MKKIFFILALGTVLTFTGCQTAQKDTSGTPDENNTGMVGMANPASVYCNGKGGKLEIRTNKQGEYGVCLFEDNRQCEEWAFFRGDCPMGGVKITGYENDAQIFCAITGGKVEGVGTKTPMCRRIDGRLCSAQANFDGECPDQIDQNPNTGNIVGGDRDEHGCIGSAGYSWCQEKQKCLRIWEESCEENSGSSVCALENCHGLDIQCGSNPPDVCTEIYMLGDKCLQYAKCGIQNGTCQQIQNAQFTQCKSCIQACIDSNKSDTMKAFDCESNCN